MKAEPNNLKQVEEDTLESIRIFIAVELNDAVRRSLARLQQKLKEVGARVRWVRPENMHLTLVFLGSVNMDRVAQVCGAMDVVAEKTAPFCFDVLGTGFFGSARSPRVPWVDIRDPTDTLVALRKELVERLRALDFEIENREFKPHLTLGRVKSAKTAGGLTSVLASAKNTHHGTVETDKVILLRSHLESQGVRYTRQHESLLKGAHTHGG